jgi:hypothetical protein
MMSAYSRVVTNKGAAGVDEMPVSCPFGLSLLERFRIKEELQAGA